MTPQRVQARRRPQARVTRREWAEAGRGLLLAIAGTVFVYACWFGGSLLVLGGWRP